MTIRRRLRARSLIGIKEAVWLPSSFAAIHLVDDSVCTLLSFDSTCTTPAQMAYNYTTTRTTRTARRESRYSDDASYRTPGGSVGHGSRSGRSHGGDFDAGFPGFSSHSPYTHQDYPPTPPRARGLPHEWDYDDHRTEVSGRWDGSDNGSTVRGSERDVRPPSLAYDQPPSVSTRGRSSQRSSRRRLEYRERSEDGERSGSVTPRNDGRSSTSDYADDFLISPAVAGSSRSQVSNYAPVIPPLPSIPENVAEEVTEVRETWRYAADATPTEYTRTTTTTRRMAEPPVYGPSLTLTWQPMMVPVPVVRQPTCPYHYPPSYDCMTMMGPGPFPGSADAGHWYCRH
ncbi:hypothetical protein FKP32DRAFT_1011061 [Trametes sanguinea]|nr:hypothetical protein FKP32DRAFT_1011061 [Trametes sanguinea]